MTSFTQSFLPVMGVTIFAMLNVAIVIAFVAFVRSLYR